jgi:hypothetical protein
VNYAQLVATNGELHFNEYDLVGSQAIRDTMLRIAPNDPKTPAPSAADLLTNVSVTVNGDTATSTSRWTGITLGADNKPAVSRAGRYEDTFVRGERPLAISEARRPRGRDAGVPAPAPAPASTR